MMGPVRRKRVEEFARLVELAVDRPGAGVAESPASADTAGTGTADRDTARLVGIARDLRGIRPGSGPDPAFKADLRAHLVSVAATGQATAARPAPARPRPYRAGVAAATATRRPAPHPSDRSDRRGASQPGRPAATRPFIPAPRRPLVRTATHRGPRLALLAGALAALVLITGITLLASGRALPGDRLYAIKRSSESFGLAMVHDPQQRGLRQLSLAQTRLGEIDGLVARGGGAAPGGQGLPAPAGTADLMVRALADMDADTASGATLVTSYAVQSRSDGLLAALSTWTAGQRSALLRVRNQLPAAAAGRAADSTTLLDRLADRVAQLRASLSCSCLGGNGSDDLGPLPCRSCGPADASQPHQPVPIPIPGPVTGGGGRSGVLPSAGPTVATPGPTGSAPARTPVPATPTTPGTTGRAGLPGLPSLPAQTPPSSTPLLCSLMGPLLCGT